jgi:hypothetical protein
MKTKPSTKKAGFRNGSFRAKTLELLSDGKMRTPEEIVKAVGGISHLGKRTPYQFVTPIITDLETAGNKVLRKDGKLGLSKASAGKVA